MAIESAPLIEQYGYVATFAGTLIEGESLLILTGLAAHRGYLSLPLVIIVGAVGGTLGDLAYSSSRTILRRTAPPALSEVRAGRQRVRTMIERHPSATILGVRFMYGLRTVGPAVIGTARIGLVKFLLLNALGALLWSACWTIAGYLLGTAAERILGNLAHVERELFIGVLVLAVILAVGVRIWQRRDRSR